MEQIKKISEILVLNDVINHIANQKNPFKRFLSNVQTELKPIVKQYNKDKEAIEEEEIKKDENGVFLCKDKAMKFEGNMPYFLLDCDEKIITERIKAIQEIECNIDIEPLDCSKNVFHSKREKDITISQWLDEEAEGITAHHLTILKEFDLLKNF